MSSSSSSSSASQIVFGLLVLCVFFHLFSFTEAGFTIFGKKIGGSSSGSGSGSAGIRGIFGGRNGNQQQQSLSRPPMLLRRSNSPFAANPPSTSQTINLQRIRPASSSSSLASSSSSLSNSLKRVNLNYQEPLIPRAGSLSSSSSSLLGTSSNIHRSVSLPSLNKPNSPAIMRETHILHRQAASMLNIQKIPRSGGLIQRMKPSKEHLQTMAKWAKNGAIAAGAGGGIAAIIHVSRDSHNNKEDYNDDDDIKNSDRMVDEIKKAAGEKTTTTSTTSTTTTTTTMKPERDTPIGIDVD